MALPLRPICLLVVLVGLPVVFPLFCARLSHQGRGWLISYLAYYVLFGCAGLWGLAFALAPSGVSQTMRSFLVTAAPMAWVALAVTLQRRPSRTAFDTGALVGCYVYLAIVAVEVVSARFVTGG